MLDEAINYPRNSDDAVKNVLIGGVLMLFSFLIVPLLFVYGYFLRVLEDSMAGREHPPEFDDWGDMAVDGVKVFVITFVYFLIPLLIFAVTVGGAILSIVSGNGGAGALAGAFLGFTVAGLVALVFYYIVPAALANFARSGELGSAFAFGELAPILTSGTYAKGWLLALGVLVGAGIVVGLLNIVPFVGAIVGVFVNFYALVAAFYIYGRAFDEASEIETTTEQAAGQAAV